MRGLNRILFLHEGEREGTTDRREENVPADQIVFDSKGASFSEGSAHLLAWIAGLKSFQLITSFQCKTITT